MYRDILIISLLAICIIVAFRYYSDEPILKMFDVIKNKLLECNNKTINITSESITEIKNRLYDSENDIIFNDSITENNLNQCTPISDYNKNQIDDSFLYSDKELDVIYGESREKESRCACEDVIDDTYYDNGDEDFIQTDDVPIGEIVDKYNELTRYQEEEQVADDFDGVYQDNMYNVDEAPCEQMGYTTFATY